VLFDIASQELVTIGGSTIEYKDISRVILWNILFFLLVISLMLAVVAWEYHRSFDVSEPIDEETLRAKGYFKIIN
jgi:heme/copper-type cytochrome/quinol oxidase subunit 2